MVCNFLCLFVLIKFLLYVFIFWIGVLLVNIFDILNFCNKIWDVRNINCFKFGKNLGFVDCVCNIKYKYSVVKVVFVRLFWEKLVDFVFWVLLENLDLDVWVLYLVWDFWGNINFWINLDWVKDYFSLKLLLIVVDLCGLIFINLYYVDKMLIDLGFKYRYKLVLYK